VEVQVVQGNHFFLVGDRLREIEDVLKTEPVVVELESVIRVLLSVTDGQELTVNGSVQVQTQNVEFGV
jgi:hypothetical protein